MATEGSPQEQLFKGCQPTLHTARLTLRPLVASDDGHLKQYAGHRSIAATTGRIAHPYEDGMAEKFRKFCEVSWKTGAELWLGIVPHEVDHVVGTVGLMLDMKNGTTELGYWVAVPFQGKGYATEAAKRMVTFAISDLGLSCVHARAFAKNEASTQVLKKIGMSYEGLLRKRAKKWGKDIDFESYSILASELNVP